MLLPEAANGLWSQLLFMVEYNIRASSILGFVGVGGIGFYIQVYVQTLQYQRLAAFLLLTLALVLLLDVFSAWCASDILSPLVNAWCCRGEKPLHPMGPKSLRHHLALVVFCGFGGIAAIFGVWLWYETRPLPPSDSTITVVDYNIFHGLYDEDPLAPDFDRFEDRLTLLAQELARLKPDVIVLQEFVNTPPKGYPDVRLVLRDALGPEYEMVFGESGTTRIDEGVLGRLTLTRLPIVSSANRAIFQGRSAHRVTVQSKGGVIDIYNVHMEGPELLDQQELEITRLLTFIDTTARNQNPVILTGDFNSRPGDAALVKVNQYGFRDVAEEKYDATCVRQGDPGCTRATSPVIVNNPRNLTNMRIDYMFARGGLDIDLRTVSAYPFLNGPKQIEGRELLWVSDHIGIQATFEIVRQPGIKPQNGVVVGLGSPVAGLSRRHVPRIELIAIRAEDVEALGEAFNDSVRHRS